MRIHDFEEEVVRLKKSLSEAGFDDPHKSRRDQATFRASLDKAY